MDSILAETLDSLKNQKKETELPAVNQAFLAAHAPDPITGAVGKVEEGHEVIIDVPAAEAAERWSYGGPTGNQSG